MKPICKFELDFIELEVSGRGKSWLAKISDRIYFSEKCEMKITLFTKIKKRIKLFFCHLQTMKSINILLFHPNYFHFLHTQKK